MTESNKPQSPGTSPDASAEARTKPRKSRSHRAASLGLIILVAAVLTFLAAALLTNIFQRKMEARNPYLKFVEVDENTTDPAIWGANWPREYDSYLRTVDFARTRYGGSDAIAEQKLDTMPWLRTLFSGYAFALDY